MTLVSRRWLRPARSGNADPVRTTDPAVVFVLEQTLGHVTHAANLRANLAGSTIIETRFVDIPPDASSWLRRVPVLANWTVRAGLRARKELTRIVRRERVAAIFVHTQVPAVLLGRRMVTTPTIVSLDATPLQYDSLGASYAHAVGPAWLENLKKRANERCFARAAHIVAWSRWARDGLVGDYGVPVDKISVIAPGVTIDQWEHPPERTAGGPVRILFVGGDLVRKGGDMLVRCFERLAGDPAVPAVELHLVTRSEVEACDGIVVHRLGPNSPELVGLYHSCHIFCLPTLGDCLPMVLSEAAVASMAVISTDVGAIHEIVRDGETGLLIPPADEAALERALRNLVMDATLRMRLGRAAHDLVVAEFDARANATTIAELLADLSAGRPVAAGGPR